MLHFKSFLNVNGPLPKSLQDKITLLADKPSTELMLQIESCHDYKGIMIKYVEYTKCTLSGKHGNTSRILMTYVKLVDIYLRFSRACRSNDLELFICEMCPLFFTTSRPNYARWMVRYYLNLLNVDQTHPGVKQILVGGALSIRRTNKTFSRTAVDLTLEQTINADAASRLTGIAAFSYSDPARRRRMLTRGARNGIVGGLFEKAGLKTAEDVSKSTKPHRIKKDNEDLKKIMDGISNTMNPFTQEPD